MAFLKFSRDKRGYEHFALVEPTTNRRGATRQRVLYMYRTPPDIKVGREPFDEALRHTLEAQYPDVSFDWRKILETPIPSADAERWRERRRAERAARQAASVESAAEEAEAADAPEDLDPPPAPLQPAPVESFARSEATDAESATPTSTNPVVTPAPAGDVARKRRRRRRGRRGRPEAAGSMSAVSGPTPETPGAALDAGHAAMAEEPHESEQADAPTESAGE